MQEIRSVVAGMRDLECRAVQAYQPIVADILRTRSRDTRHIEQTLDGLLGFCGYLSKIGDVIHVLHCFEKDSRKTDKRDLRVAKERLSIVRKRINEEKKDAKRLRTY